VTPIDEVANWEIFLWAVYQLGGSSHFVDIEDVSYECFKIAPARFGWRTRPELPDYKKCTKALQEAGREASNYELGLVQDFNKDAMEKMKSAGAVIVQISDKRPFERALEKFNKEYAEKLGPEAMALLEKAQSVK